MSLVPWPGYMERIRLTSPKNIFTLFLIAFILFQKGFDGFVEVTSKRCLKTPHVNFGKSTRGFWQIDTRILANPHVKFANLTREVGWIMLFSHFLWKMGTLVTLNDMFRLLQNANCTVIVHFLGKIALH